MDVGGLIGVSRRLVVRLSWHEEDLLLGLLRLTRLDLEDLVLIWVLCEAPHIFAVEQPDAAVV